MKLVWIRLSQNDKQVQSTLYGQLMQKALVAPIGGEHKTHCTLPGPGKTCSVTEIKKDWLLLFVSVLAEGDKLVFWEHLNTKPYYVDVKFSCGPGNLHRTLYLSVQHLKKSTNQTLPSSFILLQHFKPLPKKSCWKGKKHCFGLHSWEGTAWLLESQRLSSQQLCSASCTRLPLCFKSEEGLGGSFFSSNFGFGPMSGGVKHRRAS